MASTNTSLTVTIITSVPDPSDADLLLEAEINAADNNEESTYYIGQTYYLRLYKSENITTLTEKATRGTLSLVSSGNTATVPTPGDDKEYLTFSGSKEADLNKVFYGSLTYAVEGQCYDLEGVATTVSLTAPANGSKKVLASKAIYGMFDVTYTTKYSKYSFQSPTPGPMLIFFIGSNV